MELGDLSISEGDLGGRVPLRKFLGSKEYLDWVNDTGKTLPYSIEIIEILASLLMTFSLCLHNQLISIYYIVT